MVPPAHRAEPEGSPLPRPPRPQPGRSCLPLRGCFDDPECHRLPPGAGLQVLQCGDPTGTVQGGPGYLVANEYTTDPYAEGDPASMEPIRYERGVLAMANAGAGTNGSQF